MSETADRRAEPHDATRRVTIPVFGMSCGGCAGGVQEALQALPGVRAATVDFATHSAAVDVDAADAEAESRVMQQVVSMGYTLKAPTDAPASDSPSQAPQSRSTASLSRSSSASSSRSDCCSDAVPAESTMEAPPRRRTARWTAATLPRQGESFAPRRLRRVPCGCGGRGCLCDFAPDPDMLTEGTRLLGISTSTDHLSESAIVPSPVDVAVVTRGVRTVSHRTVASPTPSLPPKTSPVADATTTLLIEGMSCTSCAALIESRLRHMTGVLSATVNFSTMSGQVVHRTSVASLEQVLRCVADLGYTVTTQSTTADVAAWHENRAECACSTNLQAVPVYDGSTMSGYEHHLLVQGMSCASCAARIEDALRRMPSVLSCAVSFTTSTAVVTTHTPGGCADACNTIQSLGYVVADTAEMEPDTSISRTREALERTREISVQFRNVVGSALLSVPLAAAMLLMMFTDVMERPTLARVLDGIQFTAATPIVLYFGRGFFIRAWRSWQHGAYTMDTLVAIGTGSTYVYSTIVYLLTLFVYPHSHMMTYFDTAGMLTAFMRLGRYLEARAKRSTSGALIELMSLVPTTVMCVKPDGTEVRVSATQLKKGAVVRVLAGDRVPVDGTILEGSSELDEQMVTGESLPKWKSPGGEVVGGTLNITASLLIRADKVGEETMIAQVLRIVQEAQNSKPALQRAADRIAMYFVPFVLLFSLLTLAVWLLLGATGSYPVSWRGAGTSWQAFAFNFFISTVVAACPCALGLATPTAIMVGTGVGATNGVLVKSGTTLEAVRRVECVVLDKTGTITKGQLEVVRTHTFAASVSPSVACLMVGLVEAQSNHPVAKAVSASLLAESDSGSDEEAAQRRAGYEVSSVVTHGGKGVEAAVTVAGNAHQLLVGNAALLRERGVVLSSELTREMAEENRRGLTTVIAAVDGVACVVVCLADEPKPEARGVVAYLHKCGVRVMMVTGDNAGVAARIAAEVGIRREDVHAEALPAAKADIVRELQMRGRHVMFVGDGINDSPALAQANVGVALGAGTEVAIEAADAVLVRNSLVDLLNLRSLSDVTVRRIYGNFVWAFGYNLMMLPAASGLLYPFFHLQLPPVMAGAAMVLSSLSVLASSLSIRFYRPHRVGDFQNV
ncbi:copper-transporting ATPase-like protein [Novymonas esmeraldas]|uniref:Copper-transporting ATPase-like protein n=1 Tax=Novymonas esmeraldas TaxID=1808958 RepID=A0AAW0F7S2_9TRYP